MANRSLCDERANNADLVVYKYGGSSVGSIECIRDVARKIAKDHKNGGRIAVVLSAMQGETDRLTELALQLDVRCSGRELDALLSTGEQVSVALLALALKCEGVDAVSLNGTQAGIFTDEQFNKARITRMDTRYMNSLLEQGKVVIVAGFQGRDDAGNVTTLGRGGSDTTAVAIAAAFNAKECRIYTDVDGVYTADPRIEPNARCLESIHFEEMLEMAGLGSKVIQIRGVEFAGRYNVPLRVLSTFKAGEGTLITYKEKILDQPKVTGVAHNRDEAQLTITGVPDQPGIAGLILEGIAAANIEIDMIVQNVSVHDSTADFTFTVHRRDYHQALKQLEDTAKRLTAGKVFGDDTIVKVSLVGAGMRSHAGIAAKMFSALAKQGINIHMISTSEIKISIVIDEKNLESAVKCLHKAFDLDKNL